VNVGNWIREHRGIYRLADFPLRSALALMLCYLWSQNRQELPEGNIQSRSLKWAEKQENFQPKEMCFLLTSTFIELNTQKDLSFDSAQANDPYS
jgi:hypothetical protein